MKTRFLLTMTGLVFAMISTACGGQAAASAAETSTTEPQPVAVTDLDSLIEALRAAGATVETGDVVEQPFFAVSGQILKVNGADVQVFAYDSAETMEADASQIAEDGGSVGTSMVAWVEPPHFYKLDRIMVLYVGEDETIKGLLENIFGVQFAGR